MITFQSPYYFFLLLPLAVFVYLAEFNRRPAGVLFSSVAVLRCIPKTLIQHLAKYVPYLFYLGIVFWITALARPQYGQEEFRIRSNGIALMMCVDRSGSMAAIDFEIDGNPVNRLDAVKKTFRDFVAGDERLKGRPDDFIGLIAFGGYVDAFCPLTLDHATLLEMLKQIQLPQYIVQENGQPVDRKLFAEENMTAIGDAIAQAVDRLKDVKAKSKVIILLSDGEQNFGTLSPLEGAEVAKAFGMKIYTIGIGSNGEAPFLGTDVFGNKRLVSQFTSMDEETLRKVAETTGGAYYNAKNIQALEGVYEQIDKLEKTVSEGRKYTQYTEYYRLPAAWGFILISVYIICRSTRFRRLT